MSRDGILVINAGSSSIKFALYGLEAEGHVAARYHGLLEGIGVAPALTVKAPDGTVLHQQTWEGDGLDHDALLAALMAWVMDHLEGLTLRAAGHRVTHSGPNLAAPVVVDDAVIAAVEQAIPFAPLHNPNNLAPIRLLRQRFPDLPQVAVFDTGFHRHKDDLNRWLSVPRWLYEEGVRRYGFHGSSYEYIASVLPDTAPDLADGRVVVAHLGNGASLAGLHRGRAVESTMGFSVNDGLMMGTRCGTTDLGVITYLVNHKGYTLDQVEHVLDKESGLLGVSGETSDMRGLLASDSPAAALAVDLFCLRVAREAASLATALGGLDGLVFTGGIGEHAAPVRARVCAHLVWLGVTLDAEANDQGPGRISAENSAVPVWVIPTDEDVMIAQHARDLVVRG